MPKVKKTRYWSGEENHISFEALASSSCYTPTSSPAHLFAIRGSIWEDGFGDEVGYMQQCINRRNSDFKKTNSTFFINDDVSTTVAFFTSDVAHS